MKEGIFWYPQLLSCMYLYIYHCLTHFEHNKWTPDCDLSFFNCSSKSTQCRMYTGEHPPLSIYWELVGPAQIVEIHEVCSKNGWGWKATPHQNENGWVKKMFARIPSIDRNFFPPNIANPSNSTCSPVVNTMEKTLSIANPGSSFLHAMRPLHS